MSSSPPSEASFLSNLKYDFPASIIVFLVALPLCLGIALASGAPLISGIIAGIVGGIVVGTLSGSPLGVSGPAAGLAVIVLNAIQQLGAFELFLVAVVIGGAMQIALGFAGAGAIGDYFPSSVIKGMLSGIGVIIILKQIPYAFGYSPDGEGVFAVFGDMIATASPGVLIITAVCMGILVLWEMKFMKEVQVFQYIQGPLVAVLAGLGLYFVFRGTGLALTEAQLVSLPEGGVSEFFAFPDFSAITNPQVWIVGATIAIVASLETLLSVEATDKLDRFERTTPTNRELKAQGVGNVVSGFIGGLPITQVIIRSSTNIQSGGRTKASAIMHAFILLASVTLIPAFLGLIPLASLAAVLFLVGYKLAKPAIFKQMWAQGWTQFVPYVVTVAGVVLTDLLVGVGLGFATAIVIVLYENWQVPFHVEEGTPDQEADVVLRLSEHVSFVNKARLQEALEATPDGGHVVIDARGAVHVHHDVREAVSEFREQARERGVSLDIRGEINGQPTDGIGRLPERFTDGHEPTERHPVNGQEEEEVPAPAPR